MSHLFRTIIFLSRTIGILNNFRKDVAKSAMGTQGRGCGDMGTWGCVFGDAKAHSCCNSKYQVSLKSTKYIIWPSKGKGTENKNV